MSDVLNDLREIHSDAHRIGDEIKELRAEIERLRAALTKIACFDDKGANLRLARDGTWIVFDELSLVKLAREALKPRTPS